MKTLLTLFTLVFTVMFSSPSYSKWKKVAKNVDGKTFYVDVARIRKHDGYVYYWMLSDYSKPYQGYLSYLMYKQGDCKLFRHKSLSVSFYKEPMGGGKSEKHGIPEGWFYPPPNTVTETILKSVCSR